MVLGIYGSGNGRDIKEIAELLDIWDQLIFIDDMADAGMFRGAQRMVFNRFVQLYSPESAEVVITLGEPEHKKFLYDNVRHAGYSLANVIHPMSHISPSAQLGQGIIVKMGSSISCDAVIEDNTSIEVGCMIGHDCIIHKHCQISSGTATGGMCVLGEKVFVGMNASIRQKIRIGANSVIGMGSVVTHNIPDNVIAFGSPARTVRENNSSKVFG